MIESIFRVLYIQNFVAELDYAPGRYFIRRYIRFKYAAKAEEGASAVTIVALLSRLIDKSSVGTGLLASILTDKYVDHLPLYRQLQRFKRESIPIAASTLDGWVRQGLERLEIGYDWLVKATCAKGYLHGRDHYPGTGQYQKTAYPSGLLLGLPQPGGRYCIVCLPSGPGQRGSQKDIGRLQRLSASDGYGVRIIILYIIT